MHSFFFINKGFTHKAWVVLLKKWWYLTKILQLASYMTTFTMRVFLRIFTHLLIFIYGLCCLSRICKEKQLNDTHCHRVKKSIQPFILKTSCLMYVILARGVLTPWLSQVFFFHYCHLMAFWLLVTVAFGLLGWGLKDS